MPGDKIVLVLENDKDIKEAFAEVVRDLNHGLQIVAVSDVNDLETSFETYKEKIILLIVDDYPYDKMIIRAFISYAKQSNGFKGDIVAFTGNVQVHKDPIKFGYDDVLPKPFEMEQLEDLLVKWI